MATITLTQPDIERGLEIRNTLGPLGDLRHGQSLWFTEEHTSDKWKFEYRNGPSLSGEGWFDFVKRKKLRAGSKISLSRNGSNGTIKVIKK
ncbi:hypothetical protein SLA2020_324450 [Shorea laevis]